MGRVGFDVAKEMIRSSRNKLSISDDTVETLCLSASREFYDNSSSGNYKVGDMKHAYEWYVLVVYQTLLVHCLL